MKEFDQAREDFQQVIQLYPANKAAKAQVRLELMETAKLFQKSNAEARLMMLSNEL